MGSVLRSVWFCGLGMMVAAVACGDAIGDEESTSEVTLAASEINATWFPSADTTIQENFVGNQGTHEECRVRGDAGSVTGFACLLYFPVSKHPFSNVTVISATLTFYVVNSSLRTYTVHHLNQLGDETFDELSATWTHKRTNNHWNAPGAQDDYGPSMLTFGAPSAGTLVLPLGAQGRGIIETWMELPGHNLGLIIAPVSLTSSDVMAIGSREQPNGTFRPKLTVVYTVSDTGGGTGGTGGG